MKKKNYPWSKPIGETNHYCVYKDKYPVSPGHLLFIPKEDHIVYLDKCFIGAYDQGQIWIKEEFCDGYNIGMNIGAHAGQTIMYPHIHLIPRSEGDLGRYENGDAYDPTGGVRNIFPGKGKY
jgi:diadenosine tetraphosphate (Ap4A) HIT family hydrolase